MSEIRYVERLGDAIEVAAARRLAARRHRIRRLAAAFAGVALVGTGVATATSLLGGSERLAAGAVACYETQSLDGGAVVIAPDARSPVAACAAEAGASGPHVACAQGDAVAVVPGRGRSACTRLGLTALPAGYASARERMVALSHDVRALESSADCVAPEELARQVQALLDRSGWAGWRTWMRLDVEDGPCGYVAGLDGDGSRSIEPSLDVEGRRVMVFGGPR
jgi:hypothetical protein